jgi:hypothetical protein
MRCTHLTVFAPPWLQLPSEARPRQAARQQQQQQQ